MDIRMAKVANIGPIRVSDFDPEGVLDFLFVVSSALESSDVLALVLELGLIFGVSLDISVTLGMFSSYIMLP
jgi:hypothetical protein